MANEEAKEWKSVVEEREWASAVGSRILAITDVKESHTLICFGISGKKAANLGQLFLYSITTQVNEHVRLANDF